MQPRSERVGNFDHAQLAVRGRDDIEQDLEALHRQFRRKLLEAVAADHEEAAHRIGDLDAQQPLRQRGGEFAGATTLAIEAVGIAAVDIAAADHELRLAPLQQAEHLRQLRFVVLQVGVHHRDARRARRQNALDAGARKSAPADATDAARAGIPLRQFLHRLPGAVGRVIVDEDDLPRDTLEGFGQSFEQHGNVVALVECRHDDGELTGTRRL